MNRIARRSPGPIPKLKFPPEEADIVALNKFLKKSAEVSIAASTKAFSAKTTDADDIVSDLFMTMGG